MNVEMPQYVNPADFLVKMAIDTRLIDKRLTVEALVEQSKSQIQKEINSYKNGID